jgi:beta-glucosidase
MRSKKDGADIRGYFYWSLLDNYEWSEGFWPKFGLIKIDKVTQERTLRKSAGTLSSIIKKYQ